jgi:hypothetical protein
MHAISHRFLSNLQHAILDDELRVKAKCISASVILDVNLYFVEKFGQ